MKPKKIVIAVGGNAFGDNYEEQKKAVKSVAVVIADMIASGNEVVITHGNGPQVGMIHTAMSDLTLHYEVYKDTPFPSCVGMSQGYIGYNLQNAIQSELDKRKILRKVVSMVTQVIVDEHDEAFRKPEKPIGRYLSAEEVDEEVKRGTQIMEDAGRGYRRVIASPQPLSIVEIDTIKTLVNAGTVVITCGGGGIPVVLDSDNELVGVNAVIDKDFVSALLAENLEADFLIILTAVEKVAINFGKENEEWLSHITIEETKEYINQGQFAPGSMLPKVEAAMRFVDSGEDKCSLITLLEKANEGIQGLTGTRITK